jgi:hypothetical protein
MSRESKMLDAVHTPRDLTKAEQKQMFTNEARTIINWKGENFYKACDRIVHEHADGTASYCVKRVDHPGTIHEDWDGQTLIDLDAVKGIVPEVTHESTQ